MAAQYREEIAICVSDPAKKRYIMQMIDVKVVPTSLLFNNQRELIFRVNGVPKKGDLIASIRGREE